jgi:hypothetical protein
MVKRIIALRLPASADPCKHRLAADHILHTSP